MTGMKKNNVITAWITTGIITLENGCLAIASRETKVPIKPRKKVIKRDIMPRTNLLSSASESLLGIFLGQLPHLGQDQLGFQASGHLRLSIRPAEKYSGCRLCLEWPLRCFCYRTQESFPSLRPLLFILSRVGPSQLIYFRKDMSH